MEKKNKNKNFLLLKAFVKNNNLYFMNLDTKQTTQITHDGSENIFNGISDWVYEGRYFIFIY